MPPVVLAVDQGSSASRCVALDGGLRPLATASAPVSSRFPAPGLVEHDPAEILASVLSCIDGARTQAGLRWADIAAIGLAAQTETFIVWDRATGAPVYPAISWRDGRAGALCTRLREAGHAEQVRAITGLPLESAFSAAKLAWLLAEVPGARRRAQAGELLFGDVNCWLTWQLSGGASGGASGGRAAHVTEPSMAARTMLFDLTTGQWSQAMLDLFDIPARLLPEITTTAPLLASAGSASTGSASTGSASAGSASAGSASAVAVRTDATVCGGRAVIGASIGDQQAALFGQSCWQPGMAKLTLGTGAFLWCHAGAEPPAMVSGATVSGVSVAGTAVPGTSVPGTSLPGASVFGVTVPGAGGLGTGVPAGVVVSCGWQLPGDTAYAFEGFVPNAGGVLSWLRQLGLLADGAWPQIRPGALRDTGGPWCVPALFGLGTPHWGTSASADIIGLTAASTAADITQAALLGIVHQVVDAIDAVRAGLPGELNVIRVDGGLASNDSVLAAIADLSGSRLERPQVAEATALGAGALAGLGADCWDRETLGALLDAAAPAGLSVVPELPTDLRVAARTRWQVELATSLGRWQAANPAAPPAGLPTETEPA